ncbi:Type cbb3 cytochrome oxidase biogenesis protein CcoS, involved in heme b insertion [hydrothermal vent metagenome]|uniref:Type cbb3 cytochrome oxidase biogenesis protein CcoS, involved in heme b insertion n=1 Tax=hydrothermal vent metagenome TaxID=652676 RepID=A0A3B0Y3E3_9ZZZZ
MDVIYGLIPLMLILGLAGVVIFIWSVRSGQYDDLEGDANRILMDEDDPLLPANQSDNKQAGPSEDKGKPPHKGVWPDAD